MRLKNQVIDIIKKRQSIRAYKSHPLSKGTIDSILGVANCAPTAQNLQQLEYKVISNKDLIQRISDRITAVVKKNHSSFKLRDLHNLFYDAPLLILITGQEDNTWIYSDATLAVQNVMLYVTSIDLGSCFMGMARFIDEDRDPLCELHISEGRKIAGAVICGYPNERPEKKERKMAAEFFP